MRRRNVIRVVGAGLAVIVAVVASGTALAQTSSSPSSSPSGSSSSNKIVFRVGTQSDMLTANPFKAQYGTDYEMLFNAYDMLFNFSPSDLKPIPGLAKSCDHSADYKTWTCDIRSGVKWSDGQDLTAADIAFTYNFIVKNNMSAFIGYLPDNPTFSAPNATTLIWKSTKPTAAPLTPPWIPILPQHIWQRFDGDPKAAKSFSNVPAVGSGPFVLTAWKPGTGWTMVANKSYWGGSPTIDEIDYQVFNSKEASVQALKGGQIDFVDDLNATLFNSLAGIPDITQVKGAPSYFNNLAFNFGGQTSSATNNPVLKDIRVRQAISNAIDRQAIVDKVFLGDAEVGDTITLPTSPWHYTPTDPDLQTYNPDQANSLLDQAGLTKKNADGIRLDSNGKPIILNILTITDLSGSTDTGKLVQADLQQVGLGVHLIPVNSSKAYDYWAEGTFDAYLWDWGGDPDPDFILSLFTTDSCLVWSDGCYSDPAYDQMYKHQKTLLDPTQRKAYVDTMQQYIWDKMPELALDYPNYLQAYRNDRFTGYIPQPTDGGSVLFAWGPASYINLKPVAAAAGGTSNNGGGAPTGFVVAGIALVVLIVVFVVLSRRRRSEDEA